MSGNLFDDRQWLLPKGYPAIQNKKENIDIPSLKEEPKVADNPKEDNCGLGPNCPFCKAQEKQEENPKLKPPTKPANSETEHDQDKTAMGSRNGKTQ